MIHSIEDLDLDNRIFPNHPGKERIKFYTDKEINNMRVADLQAACKECGVRTQGRKAELQARLRCVKEHPQELATRMVRSLGPMSLPHGCTFPQLLEKVVQMDIAHLEKAR